MCEGMTAYPSPHAVSRGMARPFVHLPSPIRSACTTPQGLEESLRMDCSTVSTMYLYTYIPTYQHTCIPTHLHTYIPTCLHAYIPTFIPTYLTSSIAAISDGMH